MESPESEPAIVTFYSYKGGVGRSMALANVAWLLAMKYQKKVLVIDWDLEAPGLHRFFDISIDLGLLDLIDEYKDLMKQASPTPVADSIRLEKYIRRITLASDTNPATRTEKGSVAIIGAGRQDDTYAARVNGFSWEDFYEKWSGYAFVEFLKGSLKKHAEIILVDSRTGVSESGGVCTLQLPEVVVLLFALNEQNISGIESIAETILEAAPEYSKAELPPTLLIRPGRVETYLEQDKLSQWLMEAATRLKRHLPAGNQDSPLKFMKENLIPYIGAYSFGETPLAVDKDPYGDLAKSFDSLAFSVLKAAHLTDVVGPTSSLYALTPYERLLRRGAGFVRKTATYLPYLAIAMLAAIVVWQRSQIASENSQISDLGRRLDIAMLQIAAPMQIRLPFGEAARAFDDRAKVVLGPRRSDNSVDADVTDVGGASGSFKQAHVGDLLTVGSVAVRIYEIDNTSVTFLLTPARG